MRYRYTKFKIDRNGKRYLMPTIIPSIPISDTDVFVRTVVGERFDSLAQKFYGDSNLWWIIAKANDMANGKIAIDNEKKIRIPMNLDSILNSVEVSNS